MPSKAEIEAAAKALHAMVWDTSWDDELPIQRDGYLRDARIALEAAEAAKMVENNGKHS